MQAGFHLEGEVFFALCKELNTPVSLSLWLRFKHGGLTLLNEHKLDPRNYLERDSDVFRNDYLCRSYFSKMKQHGRAKQLRDVALQKFATSEDTCRETNRRLRQARASGHRPEFSAALFVAKKKIAKLLGVFDLKRLVTHSEWGPGATFDLKRQRAQTDRKMTTIPISVSPSAFAYAKTFIENDLHWSYPILGAFPEGPYSLLRENFLLTNACRLTTVPKSFKTDRVIAIEPTLNLFLQKGVGSYIRRKLKRVGIDLDDQGPNQRGALRALADSLATLDLSAASDSVSRELVFDLLPLDWFEFLDQLRSRSYQNDGCVSKLEKFSSMGNGFTFELESLIFWALSSSQLESHETLLVYGDDIIVPSSRYESVVDLLSFCGFTTNEDKSFCDGLFFESCGRHYFNGIDVTPVYQKEPIQDAYQGIRAHNRLYRWFDRGNCSSSRIRRHFSLCAASQPLHCDGDEGFIEDLHVLFSTNRVNRNKGLYLLGLHRATKVLPGIESALYALELRRMQLRGSSSDACYGDVELPGGSYVLRSRWVIPRNVSLLNLR